MKNCIQAKLLMICHLRDLAKNAILLDFEIKTSACHCSWCCSLIFHAGWGGQWEPGILCFFSLSLSEPVTSLLLKPPHHVTVSDLTLRSVGPFDEISSSFKASFRLKLTWYDHRLTYLNLNDNGNNIAFKDQLWIPALVFSTCDKDYLVKNDEMSALSVHKKG